MTCQRIFLTLVIFWLFMAFVVSSECIESSTVSYAVRLKPNEDLFERIDSLSKELDIRAGFVISAVGSLLSASIRFANQSDVAYLNGPFEITSLVGTISSIGGHHIHITVCDSQGVCKGGHFVGGLIFTTVELVIGSAPELCFARKLMPPPDSGFYELAVLCRDQCGNWQPS